MATEKYKNIEIIVLGGLNTDITAYNLTHIPQAREDVYANDLIIGPGGKSRNVAQMIATLTGPQTVAMISKTSQDPFGLWKPPYTALQTIGVNTDYIKIIPFKKSQKYPGIALISVDAQGNRTVIVYPGINNDFSDGDIDNATPIFESAQKNNGIVALSLELPIKTAIRAIETANQYNLKVILDPGGLQVKDKEEILKQKIFLIKPNEQEAKMLTGISISDIDTAQVAAELLMEKDIKNVLITHGENGAYFFAKHTKLHIPIPKVPDTIEKDSTGCGDQVFATICARLIQRENLIAAIKEAITSGTLQFSKRGIQPVTNEELAAYLH